jgi:hypothetical protein
MRVLALTLVLFLMPQEAFSQQNEKNSDKRSSYTLFVSTDWTHYIDNLEYGNKNIGQDFTGFNFRFY